MNPSAPGRAGEKAPPAGPRPTAFWRPALLILTALACGEAWVRLDAPMYRWMSPRSDDYARAVWRARLSPPPPGAPIVTIVGNSGARENLDQDELARVVGLPAYNWGLSAENLAGLASLPLAPGNGGILVLCLNISLLETRNMPDEPDLRYPWRVPAFASRLALFRGELSGIALSRLRRLWSDDPFLTGRRARQYHYREALLEHELRADWSKMERLWRTPPELTDEEALAALEALVARARGAGYRVKALWLPVRKKSPDFARATSRSARARVLLRRLGVLQIEPGPRVLEQDDFYDMGHLLASGRAKLTAELGRRLREPETP